METVVEDIDDGGSVDVRKTLAMVRRREKLNMTIPGTMASPTNAASIVAAIGRTMVSL